VRVAYLSLGTNIGDRGAKLDGALSTLSAGDAYRLSNVYETQPVGELSRTIFGTW